MPRYIPIQDAMRRDAAGKATFPALMEQMGEKLGGKTGEENLLGNGDPTWSWKLDRSAASAKVQAISDAMEGAGFQFAAADSGKLGDDADVYEITHPDYPDEKAYFVNYSGIVNYFLAQLIAPEKRGWAHDVYGTAKKAVQPRRAAPHGGGVDWARVEAFAKERDAVHKMLLDRLHELYLLDEDGEAEDGDGPYGEEFMQLLDVLENLGVSRYAVNLALSSDY